MRQSAAKYLGRILHPRYAVQRLNGSWRKLRSYGINARLRYSLSPYENMPLKRLLKIAR